MSEMKRVTLTTISDVVRKSPFGGAVDQNTESIFSGAFGGGGGTASSGGGGGKNGTAGGKSRKTVRLELALFEPTAQNFPEFNFSKLMHEEQVSARGVCGRKGGEGMARGMMLRGARGRCCFVIGDSTNKFIFT